MPGLDIKDMSAEYGGQSYLHCVFVDFERAYDRVPREEMWYCEKMWSSREVC